MIHFINGKINKVYEDAAIVEAIGIGFKIYFSKTTIHNLFKNDEAIKIFIHMHFKQDGFNLYGFLDERELQLFEKLISVSSVGPKSAISILGIATPDQIIAAINKGDQTLLSHASGIGKKTAERVILELKDKLTMPKEKAAHTVSLLESDLEIEETLVTLGYKRQQARDIIAKIDPKFNSFKDRLKDALRKAKNL